MSTSRRDAFTIIELLAVISIIAIIASLLFPAFAQAREKSRQSTCQSSIRSFMVAILMYTQDNDGNMPVSWNIMAQVGPKVAADSGGALAERGIQVELAPYIASSQALQCPDDKGIDIDPNSPTAAYATVPFLDGASGTAVDPNAIHEPLGTPASAIFGMSYKFTKENFTFASGLGGQKFTCTGVKTVCLGQGTGSKPSDPTLYTIPPPNPMSLSFFARPSETRVLRDFLSLPGNTEKWANPSTYWHPNGELVGFADGHVKLIHNSGEERALCDGPPSSPAYDGSCNAKGLERYA